MKKHEGTWPPPNRNLWVPVKVQKDKQARTGKGQLQHDRRYWVAFDDGACGYVDAEHIVLG